MNIDITKTSHTRLSETDFNHLQFGHIFSDHMIMMHYTNAQWQKPTIKPYGVFQISPANCYLHYGQAVFEGLKAFKANNGKINIFRLKEHHARLNNSCKRLCIPAITYDDFVQPLVALLKLDAQWIPMQKGCALYIRPAIFASDDFLGVKISDSYCYFVITSPVGAYFKDGLTPIRLITSGDYVRTVRGMMGETKTPANYAGSLLPQVEAKKKGFDQVLWLDGIEKKYIDEAGTANIFFLINDELITPPLDGSILNGVTRDSVIAIAKSWGLNVIERKISIDEIFLAAHNNTLKEVFSTGTAVVISPVGEIEHNGRSITIDHYHTDSLSQRLYNEITAIQYGEKEDRFEWCTVI